MNYSLCALLHYGIIKLTKLVRNQAHTFEKHLKINSNFFEWINESINQVFLDVSPAVKKAGEFWANFSSSIYNYGKPLDAGLYPSVIDNWYWSPILVFFARFLELSIWHIAYSEIKFTKKKVGVSAQVYPEIGLIKSSIYGPAIGQFLISLVSHWLSSPFDSQSVSSLV